MLTNPRRLKPELADSGDNQLDPVLESGSKRIMLKGMSHAFAGLSDSSQFSVSKIVSLCKFFIFC